MSDKKALHTKSPEDTRSKPAPKRKVDTGRWYEDNDISTYVDMIVDHELGGYKVIDASLPATYSTERLMVGPLP